MDQSLSAAGRFGRAGRTKAVKEEPRVERDASHDFTLTYDVRHPEVPTVRTPGAEGGYVLNQSPLPDPDAAGPFVFPVPASLRAAPADHMWVAPDPTRPQEWASTTDDLVGAGFLSRSPRGILVTPEGLAAVLDAVPVEVMRTASPTEALSAVRPDAPTSPSKARRTSAVRSAPRSPKPN